MDLLLSMRIFKKVADARSFKAAAEAFRLSPTSVTKAVQALEERLGARLLQRTTRRTSLTEAGALYLERCTRLLDDLAEAEALVGEAQAAPQGHLRVGTPLGFGITHLGAIIATFAAAHPRLRLDVHASDQFLDLVENGYDVVVRIAHRLRDSSAVAVKLAPVRTVVVAAPEYLAKHGTPRTPADLREHAALLYSQREAPASWTFARAGRSQTVEVREALRANNSLILREAPPLPQPRSPRWLSASKPL